eukprot:Lankesteria_metandrocarpae@DN1456_c0_g1_i2.p1
MVVDEFSAGNECTAVRKHYNESCNVPQGLDRTARATVEQVLDRRTFRILDKLKITCSISELNGTISTGKEANVYHAVRHDGSQLAVKIFRTSILAFKDRSRYVDGEHRFRRGYVGSGNSRKMVAQWAQKEFRNLCRISLANMPCPSPLSIKSNVLVMEFCGDDKGEAAPRLKDVTRLSQDGWRKAYVETVAIMRCMFQRCNLVHGDLSEYNLLYHDGHVCVIDVSQAVMFDHENAFDFLKRDCTNVTAFFSRNLSGDTSGVEPVQTLNTDGSVIDEGDNYPEDGNGVDGDPTNGSCFGTEMLGSGPDVVKGLVDTGAPAPIANRLNATATATAGATCTYNDSWEHLLSVRGLFDLIILGDRLHEERRSTAVNGAAAVGGGMRTAHGSTRLGSAVFSSFESVCSSVAEYLSESQRGDLGSEDEVEDDNVFLNSWVASNLHQVSDYNVFQQLSKGDQEFAENVMCWGLHTSGGLGSTCVGDVLQEEDNSSGSERSSGDESSSEGSSDDYSSDNGTKASNRQMSYVNGKFTGVIPEGTDRKDWKRLVKEEQREKRKTKMPKHIKKKKTKGNKVNKK